MAPMGGRCPRRRDLFVRAGSLVGLATIAALTQACGGAAPSPTAAPPTQAGATKPAAATTTAPATAPTATAVVAATAPAKPVARTLVFLSAGNLDAPAAAPRKQVYTDFMAQTPGVTFDIRALPGGADWDRLARTAVSAGEAVDLLAINGQFVRAWVRDNLLFEISSDKDMAPVLARIDSAFLEAASPGGKRYYTAQSATLGGANVAVLYYNKTLLDKAAMQTPKSLDDLKAMIGPLKSAGAAPMVHPSGEIWWNPLLVMWIQPMVVNNQPIEFTEKTMKGEIKYTSPEWIRTFDILAGLSKDGVLLPGSGALGMDAAIQVFYQGKAALTYNGSWTLPSLRKPPDPSGFAVRVAGLPVVPGAAKAQPLITAGGASIPLASKQRETALAWLKFVANPDIDARVVAAMQEFSPMQASNAKITDPVSSEVAPWFKDGIPPLDWLWEPEITVEIQNRVQGLIKGEATPQAAAEAVQAKAEQLRREGRAYYK